MERITRMRAGILLAFLALVIFFFGFKLYDLQVIQTGGKVDNTTVYTTLTRVKAARGDILDRNGNKLVSNRASYDLVFNHYVILSSKNPNESILRLVKLCQAQGIEYTDHFPISATRPFRYELENYTSAWQNYFQDFLHERGELDSDITAPLLIRRLRDIYDIPEEWSDEDARLVLGVRYELTLRNSGVAPLPNYIFIEDVTDSALSYILELHVPGLRVEESTIREYHTEYAAHILGYVGAMTPEQWETIYKDLPNYPLDAMVGQSGFELAYEQHLHGIDGTRVDETTRDGTVVRSWYKVEPQAGNHVEVSIDLSLQMIGEDALAKTIADLKNPDLNPSGDGADAEGAALVAIDVKTGQILVCASYPTYNLSNLREDWDEILNTDYDPLVNRALNAVYPPGSTYKMSMAVAAINAGIITSTSNIYDKGIFTKYEGFSPTCLRYTTNGTTHGDINVMQALKHSCNYFFYELGDKITLNAMDSTAKGFGLGEKTGVELSEKVGHRANAESKALYEEGYNASWVKGDQILAAIGQSHNLFSPMQLCVYASTLANEGNRYSATFLNRVVSSDYRSLVLENLPKLLSTMEISTDALYAYKTGMQMVAHEAGGTAYNYFRNYPINVCAKTGTAEHGGGKTASDHGAFLCYAPAEDPQIAIVVYGEKAGHGSTLAGVAKAMLDVYFDVDEIGDVVTGENQIG